MNKLNETRTCLEFLQQVGGFIDFALVLLDFGQRARQAGSLNFNINL
jgi:hypothetical protein